MKYALFKQHIPSQTLYALDPHLHCLNTTRTQPLKIGLSPDLITLSSRFRSGTRKILSASLELYCYPPTKFSWTTRRKSKNKLDALSSNTHKDCRHIPSFQKKEREKYIGVIGTSSQRIPLEMTSHGVFKCSKFLCIFDIREKL